MSMCIAYTYLYIHALYVDMYIHVSVYIYICVHNSIWSVQCPRNPRWPIAEIDQRLDTNRSCLVVRRPCTKTVNHRVPENDPCIDQRTKTVNHRVPENDPWTDQRVSTHMCVVGLAAASPPPTIWCACVLLYGDQWLGRFLARVVSQCLLT